MNLWRRAGTIRRYLVSRIRARIAYEQEIFDLVANLDTTRRSLTALRAEHERLLRMVGINAIADQTIDLEAARAEVERLTAENDQLACKNNGLRWENLQWLRQTVEGPTS